MDIGLHRIDVAALVDGSLLEGLAAPINPRVPVDVFGVGEHTGDLRRLVLALKYRGDTQAARALAEMVAVAVRAEIPSVDRVTWAPTTDSRRDARGFDQAEMIARHVSALTSLRAGRVLRRVNTGSQTRSTRAERLQRPQFVARPRTRGHVLVIDDVVTTGATFVAAARALAEVGVERVTCVAPSWTPHKETWRQVDRATWRQRDMETGRLGDKETWRHGSLTT